MKKILLVLFTLLLLAACSSENKYSYITSGDDVLFETNNKTYTSKEAYADAKKMDVSEIVLNNLEKKIAELKDVDLQAIEDEVDEEIRGYEDSGNTSFIEAYYGSIETYRELAINSQINNELLKIEVNNDFDNYVKDYSPFKAAIVELDDKDLAEKIVKKASKKGTTFAYACNDAGYEQEVSETVQGLNKGEFVDEVKTWISDNESGISPVLEVANVETDDNGNSNTTYKYYVINLVSKNAEDFKDEFLDLAKGDVDQTTMINNYIKQYGLEIYDQDVYDAFTSKYEAAK